MAAETEIELQQAVQDFMDMALTGLFPPMHGTLCRPGRRVYDVTPDGGHVRLRVRGPRRAVHADLRPTPEQARGLAADLLRAADEVDAAFMRELAQDIAGCAAYDVPGLPGAAMPS